MGVRILRCEHPYPSTSGMAVIYCSTTEWAFGPVFHDQENHDSLERAELFLQWLGTDARTFTDSELESKYHAFLKVEEELWLARERQEEERFKRLEEDA